MKISMQTRREARWALKVLGYIFLIFLGAALFLWFLELTNGLAWIIAIVAISLLLLYLAFVAPVKEN